MVPVALVCFVMRIIKQYTFPRTFLFFDATTSRKASGTVLLIGSGCAFSGGVPLLTWPQGALRRHGLERSWWHCHESTHLSARRMQPSKAGGLASRTFAVSGQASRSS